MANRVLLVESDVHLAEFWEKVMAQEGLEVIRLADTNQVSVCAREGRVDLLLLGSSLRPEQAVELLAKLREEAPDLMVIAPLNEEAIKRELIAAEDSQGGEGGRIRVRVDQVRLAVREALAVQENGNSQIGPHRGRFHPGSIPKLSEMERYLIEESLALAEGNQTRAAKRLGISRFALRNRMRRYGILLTHARGVGEGRKLKWEKQDSISTVS